MATLATQSVTRAGTVASYTAASAGDKCATGDGVFLHVKNGSASSVDVTLVTPGTVEGLAVEDRVVSVAAGDDAFIAVPNLYRNSADGLADVQFAPTDPALLVAALRAV